MQLWHFLQQLPYHSVSKVPCCPGHPAVSAYFFRRSDTKLFCDDNAAGVKPCLSRNTPAKADTAQTYTGLSRIQASLRTTHLGIVSSANSPCIHEACTEQLHAKGQAAAAQTDSPPDCQEPLI